MPPIASRDSPRTLHGRRRAPRGQLARSGSFFGALKNIVTAPLAWLTSYDDHENVSGKRARTANTALEGESTYHEDQPSAKRKRVDSPPAPPPQQATRTAQGYLDVPENLLSQRVGDRHRQTAPAGHGRSASVVNSLNIPAGSGVHPARRTASPTGLTSYMQPSMMQRTQSMDPPAYRALSLSRDVSMEDGLPGSASRDVTMSPSRHTPFQLRPRNSMTPQPTGQAFGPVPRHKERDASEPPPLASLISKPVFVKPPAQATQSHPEQVVTTLGSIAESNGRMVREILAPRGLSDCNHIRQSRSPMRQHSSLFLGARPGPTADTNSTGRLSDVSLLVLRSSPGKSVAFVMPVNAAEKALHDLDVYKTPLLPSRLRGSQTIPEMFQPKKAHAPVLMRSDRDRERKPRLGTSEKKGKKQDEDVAAAAKPYAGRGGMKKMLAKRKLEEQEELEKERASAIETDQDEAAETSAEIQPSELASIPEMTRLASPPPAPAPPARPIGGREQSSLRVGRTRTSRNHIARPVTKAKNRFSAAYDEDDGEDVMLDDDQQTEEPKKLPTLFESPKGFSFAQDVSDRTPFQVVGNRNNSPGPQSDMQKAPILHDSSNAKEPPIPALPFSIAKASPTPPATASSSTPILSLGESFKPPAPGVAQPSLPKTPDVTNMAPAAPMFPSVPSISLVPPSPAPVKAPEATAPSSVVPSASTTTTSSIPNFFVNSSVFSKPGVTIAPPAAATTPAQTAKPEVPVAPPAFTFGGQAAPTKDSTEKPFSFPTSGVAPSSAPSFSFPPTKEAGASQPNAASQPANSLFAMPQAAATPAKVVAPPTNGAEVKATPSAPAPFTFPPVKPAETSSASTSLPFSFGATPAPSSGGSATSTPVPGTTAPSAPFAFGQPKTEPSKPEEPKPLFGSTEPAKPSPFGAPAPSPSPFGGSQINTVAEPPKPAFTFGQSTPSSSTPAPTIEAPKPLFPSTSSGGTGGFTFGSTAPSVASPATPAKSPFAFGAAPSTPPVSTPVDNKPAFTFGASTTPSVSAPNPLFGGASTGSHGADVSKPFTFGGSGPTRPITPPQKEQDMRMEESPTRGSGMDMNGEQQPTLKLSNGFTFGAPSTSSPFGQPSQSAASPFGFGGKTETKVETKPASSFGSFGQSTTTSGFPFGQKPAESVQSPISPAPFGASTPFGQTPTTSAPAFSFGAPASSTGGFGQPSSAVNSQPASPSTFGQQQAPFGFGSTPTSATAPSNPFAFGSQPASPATGNAGLPQPPGSSGGPSFTFGASSPATTQAPSSPFGAAPTLPSGGGVGFTIGSAAPQVASGARQIKKLPNRRGGRLR